MIATIPLFFTAVGEKTLIDGVVGPRPRFDVLGARLCCGRGPPPCAEGLLTDRKYL